MKTFLFRKKVWLFPHTPQVLKEVHLTQCSVDSVNVCRGGGGFVNTKRIFDDFAHIDRMLNNFTRVNKIKLSHMIII